MKKIFSFAIVMAAVALVSCGGNANKPAQEAEVEETTIEVVEADSTACACEGECAEGECACAEAEVVAE